MAPTTPTTSAPASPTPSEQSHHDRVEHGDQPVGPRDHRLQHHAEDCGGAGHEQVPVHPDDDGRLIEHDVAEQASSECDGKSNHDDAEHVDAAMLLRGCEESTLQAAETCGEKLDPQ